MTSKDTSRRRFLQGSVVGQAMLSLPASAMAAPEPPTQPVVASPNPALAQAEAGPVDTRPGEGPVIDPGSDFMVDVMRAAGIRYASALVGSTFRGLHESILNYAGDRDLQLIVCVHEEISAAFAHGYAKVSGKPMACMVHSDVGLQHASMAIYNAYCDRAPMMVIVGNVLDAAQRRPGVEWLHSYLDVASMVRDFIKWDDTPLSLQDFGESFMRGHALATTPPYGPVLIVADADLQEKPIADRRALSIPRQAEVAPPSAGAATVAQLADMLLAAERPVLVADRAARSQAGVDNLVKLAELLNAPVIDQGGRMNMPTNHYLNQSMRRVELVSSADLVVGFELSDIWGTLNAYADLVQRRSHPITAAGVKVAVISANYAFIKPNTQDIQRYYAADLTVAADSESCLESLVPEVARRITAGQKAAIAAREPALRAAHAQMRQADAKAAAIGWDASPITTARMAMELWEQVKGLDWAIVGGTTFSGSWPQRLWDMDKSYQFIGDAGGYGLGYNAPASAGAALAHKEAGRIPISIQGDGDLMCVPGTLWTLAHHEIPLLTLVHNNRAWHQETMHVQRMCNRRDRGADHWMEGTTITGPLINYAQLAQSMGVWAEGPINEPDRLAPAIRRALDVVKSGRPALLDVVCQPR